MNQQALFFLPACPSVLMSGNTMAGERWKGRYSHWGCCWWWRPSKWWRIFVWCRFSYDGDVWPGREGVQQHTWSVSGARFVQQLPLLQVTPRRSGVTAHQVSKRHLETHCYMNALSVCLFFIVLFLACGGFHRYAHTQITRMDSHTSQWGFTVLLLSIVLLN